LKKQSHALNEFFAAVKKRSNYLEKTVPCLISITPRLLEPERAFSATGQFVTKLRNRLNDERVL